MTEYFFVVKCPFCGQEHRIWSREPLETELVGNFTCPVAKKIATVRVKIEEGVLRFSKEEIKRAYDEADEEEHMWWLQEYLERNKNVE